jgi:hypothetical protein
LKIDSVDQKFNLLECGNFSQDAGTPGTERVITFSQLAVKGLMVIAWKKERMVTLRPHTPEHIRGGWSNYTDTSEPVAALY